MPRFTYQEPFFDYSARALKLAEGENTWWDRFLCKLLGHQMTVVDTTTCNYNSHLYRPADPEPEYCSIYIEEPYILRAIASTTFEFIVCERCQCEWRREAKSTYKDIEMSRWMKMLVSGRVIPPKVD